MNVDSSIQRGVFYDMPFELYASLPALNQTPLKRLSRSAAHFKAEVDDEEEEEPTTARKIGRLISSIALEPKREPWWVVKPEGMKLSEKEGKHWKKQQGNLEIISFNEFTIASGCATAIWAHDTCSKMLHDAKTEVTVVSSIETEFGPVMVKCRPDIVPSGNVLVDIKSCQDARPEAFLKQVLRYGYALQLAFYIDNWNRERPDDRKDHALLIAVEKLRPYCIWVHRVPGELLEHCRMQYLDLINMFAQCRNANSWPGYPDEIVTLNMPDYLRSKIGY